MDVEPTYSTVVQWGRNPVQGTLGLANNNSTWTGDLEIFSGNVILKAGNALVGNNSISFTAPDSLHTAGLYLNGNGGTIGSLSGIAAGKSLLVNGGTSDVALTINQSTDTTFNGTLANGPDQGYNSGQGMIWSGHLALVKQGPATLTLGGSNYYSGGTTLNAGGLKLTNPKALGDSTGGLTINAGTLDINGQAGVSVGNLSGSSGRITNNSTRAASLNTTVSDGTFRGVIADGTSALAFGKGGVGALWLNTAHTYTGGTTLTGGTLDLDFTAGGAPLDNILPNGTLLTVGGSTLELFGASSTANTQTVGNLTFTPGGSAFSVFPGSGGGSLILTAGHAWTREAGSALQVVLPVSGGTLSSSPAVSNGVVVGSGSTAFAVVSTPGATDWATVSGGQIAALGTYSNNGYGAGQNTNVTVANPSPAAFTTGTLAFRTAQANTLSLTGTNTLSLGGLLVGDQVGANITTISGGSLTSGSNELLVHQYNADPSGTLNLNSRLVNNGSNPLLLVKAGPGKLVLNNAGNSFTGGTVVGGGTLVIGAAGALGATSNPLTVVNGILDLGGNGLIVGSLSGSLGTIANNGSAATLTVNSSASTSFGGTLADGSGALTLTKSGSGTLVLSGTNTYTGGTNITGGVVSVKLDANLGAASSPLYFNGGTLSITAGKGKAFASTTHPLSWGSGGATLNIADPDNVFTISQAITSTNGQGDFVKTGPGTLRLANATADNTHTGATRIYGGTVLLDHTPEPGAWGPWYQKLGPGPLVLGGATVAIYGNGYYNFSQPGYAGGNYGDRVYQETVASLTLAPGDSCLQSSQYWSWSVGNITRSAGGTADFRGGEVNGIKPGFSYSGGGASVTRSLFHGRMDNVPLVNDNYWDTEFANIGPTAVPNISTWTAGQDVTNQIALPTAYSTDLWTPPPLATAFSGSLATDLTVNSLRFLPSTANTVNLGGHKLEVSSGGILVTFNSQNNGSHLQQITGGTITAGNGNYGGDLIIHQYNTGVVWSQYSQVGGDLEIGAVVANAADPTGKAGDTAIGSSTISGLASTADLYPGMPISGAGIPVGAKITAINDGTSITISAAATANGTATGLTIQSANGLTKSGPGRLILSGNNTYTGPTFLNNGITWVNGNQSAANGAVTVAYGATLGGTGTLGGAVIVQDGGIVAPGTATPGTLNLANGLDMSAADSVGANLVWRMDTLSTSTGFDALALAGGNLALGGLSKLTLDFSLLGEALRPDAASPNSFWLSNETWKIIGLGVGATNAGGTNFTSLLNDTFAMGTFSTYVGTGADTGSIFLKYTVASVPSGNYWAPAVGGGGTGTWSSGSSVWAASSGTQGTLPQSVSEILEFGDAAGTVTVNGTVSVNRGMNFTSDGYSVVAGASTPNVSLNGSSAADNTITVSSGSAVSIAVPVTGGGSYGLTKAGDGTLVLDANNTYTGGTTVTGGAVLAATADALSVGGNLTIATGASVHEDGNLGDAVQVRGLSISGTGVFNLSGGKLVVDGSVTSEAAVRAYLVAGRNGGNWAGTGITSSWANANSVKYAVGYMKNSDLGSGLAYTVGTDPGAPATWFGRSATMDSVFVRLTYAGDADLSGDVSTDDFDKWKYSYAESLSPTWYHGDFDYSGYIDTDDFDLWKYAYSFSYPALDAPYVAAVPEAGTLALLALGCAGLWLARRCRRTKNCADH